jgi:hypothetical protein
MMTFFLEMEISFREAFLYNSLNIRFDAVRSFFRKKKFCFYFLFSLGISMLVGFYINSIIIYHEYFLRIEICFGCFSPTLRYLLEANKYIKMR